MVKAYTRIHFEDTPSTATPLSAENLNAIDIALNTIDNRVLQLSNGFNDAKYYSQQAEGFMLSASSYSAQAKTSEANAKTYMENAFAGTPEGYDSLVETVANMDIQTTDNTTMATKKGGLKVNGIYGATVQNGTPTPDIPVAIQHPFDVVKTISGYYNTSTGDYSALESGRVCNKRKIPCKSGDTIKVSLDSNASNMYILYYGESGFISTLYGTQNSNYIEGTAPSGTTSFCFYIVKDSITPDTVGKIALTINEKYVAQFVECGKNLFNGIKGAITTNGITLTPNGDGTYVLNGTSTGATITLETAKTYKRGSYTISGNPSSNFPLWLRIYGGSTVVKSMGGGSGILTLTEDTKLYVYITIDSGVTLNNVLISPMVEKGTVATDYEPYTEHTATAFLESPLCESDVMDREKVNRKRKTVVFDGSDDEIWGINSAGNSYFYITVGSYGEIVDENIISSHFQRALVNATTTNTGIDIVNSTSFQDSRILVRPTTVGTVDEWKTWLQSNPITVEYELATPTTEVLDTDSQIALNSLKTFEGATNVTFDTVIQPTWEVEYGASQVGAYTLEGLLKADTNAIKINELSVALVATGSEV